MFDWGKGSFFMFDEPLNILSSHLIVYIKALKKPKHLSHCWHYLLPYTICMKLSPSSDVDPKVLNPGLSEIIGWRSWEVAAKRKDPICDNKTHNKNIQKHAKNIQKIQDQSRFWKDLSPTCWSLMPLKFWINRAQFTPVPRATPRWTVVQLSNLRCGGQMAVKHREKVPSNPNATNGTIWIWNHPKWKNESWNILEPSPSLQGFALLMLRMAPIPFFRASSMFGAATFAARPFHLGEQEVEVSSQTTICLVYAWYMLGICLVYAWYMLGICLVYAWYMLSIMLKPQSQQVSGLLNLLWARRCRGRRGLSVKSWHINISTSQHLKGISTHCRLVIDRGL